MEKKTYRNPGLDIIRSVALFCVIAIHFFIGNEFYDDTILDSHWILPIIIRNSFMICVPLFMMLTGYLNRSSAPCLKYYTKLVRILFVYIASSLFCVLYQLLVQRAGLSFTDIFFGLFSYQDAPYSWYVEMYIGLFLLIPFLNVLYDGLPDKQAKQSLMLTMLLLTAIPSVTNIFRFTDAQWWITPSASDAYQPLLPDWWTAIYPLTYFYLGRYLRDYPLKLNSFVKFILILFVLGISGVFSFYRSHGSKFICGVWQDYGSFLITLQTVLIFSFFQDLNYERWPSCLIRLFAVISELSFGAYLTSWVFDQICYVKLQAYIPSVPMNLKAFLILIPLILLGSLAASGFINFIYTHTVKKLLTRYLQNREVRAS